jgi:hypothetical protein
MWKMIFQENGVQKQAGIAILISKLARRQGYFILIKTTNIQEETTI